MPYTTDSLRTAGIIWRLTTSVAGRCQGLSLRIYGIPRRSSVIAGSLENRLEPNNFNRLSVLLTCSKLRRNLEIKTAKRTFLYSTSDGIEHNFQLFIYLFYFYFLHLTLSMLNFTLHHFSFPFF